MYASSSRKTVTMLVALVCVAALAGLLAQSALAYAGCQWQPVKADCTCCGCYTGCCGVPVCYSGYQYQTLPQTRVPQGWVPSCGMPKCCAPVACCGPCLTTVQIAIGQGQPEAVRAWRWGNDVLVPVREVFQKLGAEVVYRSFGMVDVTLGGKTVQLRAYGSYAYGAYACGSYPQGCCAWPAAGPTAARMLGCKVHAPVSGLAAELGVTVDKEDAVIRLTP